MSKLADVFKNHKVFIPFIVADDPDFETTVKNVVALAKGGADIVELGIPFFRSSRRRSRDSSRRPKSIRRQRSHQNGL
ncbi:MAG: hypothetical protein ACFWT8_13670 [Lacticaseibacillus casei]